jgi:hypothetical protein
VRYAGLLDACQQPVQDVPAAESPLPTQADRKGLGLRIVEIGHDSGAAERVSAAWR